MLGCLAIFVLGAIGCMAATAAWVITVARPAGGRMKATWVAAGWFGLAIFGAVVILSANSGQRDNLPGAGWGSPGHFHPGAWIAPGAAVLLGLAVVWLGRRFALSSRPPAK